jgi:SAM-dependent methyltransferase
VRCTKCGLGFVNPRPSYEEIGTFYPASFYESFDKEHEYHRQRYSVEARIVEGALGHKGRLLDVGCANGDFPRFMLTRGWDVEGVEVSDSSKTITDFKVWRQEFGGLEMPDHTYDAVTAWAVLEHVHQPKRYFEKAARVIKPGGVFVFLVTNFRSLSSWALFREDVPRHLYFFTESTIRRYLADAHLELVSADYSDRVYAMRPVNWLRYFLEARLLGRTFTWQDAEFSRATYLSRRGWAKTPWTTALFIATHPHFVFDRLLLRVYELVQMKRRTYGIVTYVARKPAGGM